jgi:hypothetical protein
MLFSASLSPSPPCSAFPLLSPCHTTLTQSQMTFTSSLVRVPQTSPSNQQLCLLQCLYQFPSNLRPLYPQFSPNDKCKLEMSQSIKMKKSSIVFIMHFLNEYYCEISFCHREKSLLVYHFLINYNFS